MSRSKHTRPRHILAATRICAPYEPRGADDSTTLYREARRLKESGIILSRTGKHTYEPPFSMPRIIVQRPSAGHYHPASRRDILDLLAFFGEQYIYGLRRIVLACTPTGPARRGLLFGRLLVPGTIVLYEQPLVPWVLPGNLTQNDCDRLSRAGAQIEQVSGGLQTIVHWPGSTLRDFVLFDGLMHEIAHHTLQQYTGKRTVRIARTADHEAYAGRFVEQCRLRYVEAPR